MPSPSLAVALNEIFEGPVTLVVLELAVTEGRGLAYNCEVGITSLACCVLDHSNLMFAPPAFSKNSTLMSYFCMAVNVILPVYSTSQLSIH